MIFIAGGTLAFFLEFLLLAKKNKTLSDKILTFWMFTLGIHLFLYYFQYSGLIFTYPHLLGIMVPFPLLHGPLLFLYTGSLTGYFIKWKTKYLLHFLPVLIFYGYYFDFFISTGEEKLEYVKAMSVKPGISLLYLFIAIIISGFSYIFITFLLIRNHRRNILNNFSYSSEKNNLHWLRNLIIGLLVIWMVVVLSNIFLDSSQIEPAIYLTVTIFVVSIGFFGLRQGNIFVNFPDACLDTDLNFKNQKRYSKSGMKEERSVEIQNLLVQLMEEQKLFLDENISLPKLAGIVNIHPNYLSQVINEKFQKNFYDFINSYRVEEFKQLVAQGKHKRITIYALSMDCGFNSKASFNQSFKKITGITPSEFVKSF